MIKHLVFLNGLACFYLILFSPVAVRQNSNENINQLDRLREAGVIIQERLETYASSIGKPEIARDREMLSNWLTDASATNHFLVFPAFMVFLFNTLILLRMWLRP